MWTGTRSAPSAHACERHPSTLARTLCLPPILGVSPAVKPFLLQPLMDRHDLDRICYFDPDIRVHGDLSPISELLDDRTMVVTPHITDPMPRDGRRPSETEILM